MCPCSFPRSRWSAGPNAAAGQGEGQPGKGRLGWVVREHKCPVRMQLQQSGGPASGGCEVAAKETVCCGKERNGISIKRYKRVK